MPLRRRAGSCRADPPAVGAGAGFGCCRSGLSGLKQDRFSAQAASLGFETDAVAFDRLFDGGAERMAGSCQCIDEVFDEPQVGACVKGTLRQLFEVADLFRPASESPDMKTLFVAEDFAVCHFDVGAAAVILREHIHRKREDGFVFEFHRQELMDHHVVVAAIDAAPVRPLFLLFHEDFVQTFAVRDIEIRYPVAAVAVEIDGGIGAVALDGAVDASFGTSLGSVGGAEPAQRTEGAYFPAGTSGDP